MKKSIFTDQQINQVMEVRGINRKSAMKFLNKQSLPGFKADNLVASPQQIAEAFEGNVAPEVTAAIGKNWNPETNSYDAPVTEFANPTDAPIVVAAEKQLTRRQVIKRNKKALKAAAPKKQSEAGKARSAGVQDFILAGRPTREQFIAVYGPKGPAMTWAQRSILGIDAAHFQHALKTGSCVAPAVAPKAKSATK